MNTPHVMTLDLDETFNVTLLDANHCPGAVMYVFEGYFGVVVATGDFRYTPSMFVDTPLGAISAEGRVELCYLDNTYLNPKFDQMPTRDEALNQIVELINTKRSPQNQVLFRLLLRNVGKEDLLIELSKHFATKIVILSERRYRRLVNIIGFDSKYFSRYFGPTSFLYVDDSLVSGSESPSEYHSELLDFIGTRQVRICSFVHFTLNFYKFSHIQFCPSYPSQLSRYGRYFYVRSYISKHIRRTFLYRLICIGLE